jgi:hypothetical protein
VSRSPRETLAIGRDLVVYLPLAVVAMSAFVFIGVFAADGAVGKIASVVVILAVGLAFSTAMLRQRHPSAPKR